MENSNQLNNSNLSQQITKVRKYELEFKQQVIGVFKSGIYATVSECAIAYDIPVKTLHTWLHQYKKQTSPDVVLQQQTEINQLKKELTRAKMELEILKKASIYFANLAR